MCLIKMSVQSKLKSVACISLLLWAGNNGGLGAMVPPLFFCSKKKKRKQEKTRYFITEIFQNRSISKQFKMSLF